MQVEKTNSPHQVPSWRRSWERNATRKKLSDMQIFKFKINNACYADEF